MKAWMTNSSSRANLWASGPLWPLVLIIIGVLAAGVGATALYLPDAMRSAAIDAAYRGNLEVADLIKIARGYYTQHVVAKAVKTGALTPSYAHKDNANEIPLPATFVIDISDLLKERATTLSLVSPYPWPHRADRKMDDFESTAWAAFQQDPSTIFSRQEVREGKRVLRVAVADRLATQTCVACHNTHPQSVKRDWKVGDVRAVMQVTRIIEPYLAAAENRSRTIIWSAAAAACLAALALVVVSALVARRTREKQDANRHVHFLAHHDAMTGVLNRSSFVEALDGALRTRFAARQGMAVHYVDLDGFKEINDRFGHSTGDELIRHVGERLRGIVRHDDLVARVGGDEFAIAQLRTASEEDALKRAAAIVRALSTPFTVQYRQLSISASVGVAFDKSGTSTADNLLKTSDVALYRAKASGRNCSCLFTPDMGLELAARRDLEQTVRDAAEAHAFELHFQPIIGANTGCIEGFEALLRLPNKNGGYISPATFIPIAEKIGVIAKIGAWVLHRACDVAAAWPPHLTVAVNLSPYQFKHQQDGQRVGDLVARALEVSSLAPSRLELEITESLLLETTTDVLGELQRLKQLGVSLVLDDFGTGYSSLSYLWKLPLDKVKIDRTFINAATELGRKIHPVLDTIVSLGRALDMHVTAEGIETPEQADYFATLGCDQMQGYFFSRPVPETDVAVAIMKDYRGHLSKHGAARRCAVNG